ncbi:MAG: DNA repair protein RecN [Oscillospiraceae bacterium]|nr:DNA repair protein RecN [Oscillospiraceae bacterium]
MLRSLHIENIAVIERADIEFSQGLNVLTGETGAGKSIVIDSIQAVLGGRTTRELVRTGAEKASVSAVFDGERAAEWCRENEIEEEEELLLQRRITAEGKSSCRVNGQVVSVSQLRELGALLIDIHGQNDGRQLMDERLHLGYLDRFGVEEPVLERFRSDYAEVVRLRREESRLQLDEAEKLRLEDTLNYRIAELEKASLRPGEEQELSDRRDLLRNSEKLTEQLDTAYAALYEGDESAVPLCDEAEYAANRAVAWCPELQKAAEELREASMLLRDAAELIREKRGELDFSPEEYDRLESRLSLLRRLERKYQRDEAGLIALLEEDRDRLQELSYADETLAKIRKELSAAEKRARSSAEQLSLARREAGARLEQRVVQELRELNMPSVRFLAEFMPVSAACGFDANGADSVRFIMSANAGETPGPISRIASGGELSRIMLALKNVFAQRDAIPTQIFDEVDTGVSGLAAQKVGEKLSELSATKQVLCVTHLPQIAAMADTQLRVEKRERDGRTYTELVELDRQGRMEELSRLTGNGELSEALLQSAGEMLERAAEFKAAARQRQNSMH